MNCRAFPPIVVQIVAKFLDFLRDQMCPNRLMLASLNSYPGGPPVSRKLANPLEGFSMQGLNCGRSPTKGRSSGKRVFNNPNSDVKLLKAISGFSFRQCGWIGD